MSTHRKARSREKGGRLPDMQVPQSARSPQGAPQMSLHWALLTATLLVLAPTLVSAQCPIQNKCHCEATSDGKVIINCRYENLDTVPEWTNTGQKYHELTLANNRITRLERNAFSQVDVKRLDLSANQITYIDPEAFAGLEDGLEELILHVNGMTDFPTGALNGLVKLRVLMLDGFSIAALPQGALSNLSHINMLKLENCQLEQVMAGDLNAFAPQLVSLSLRNNKLQNLLQSTISGLPKLQVLDLFHNKLAVLPDNLFSGNSNLSTIDFSNNQLQTVRVNAYVGLETSLTSLNLQNNQLTDNQLKPLKLLQSIRDLNLANNRIMNIPADSLVNAQKLNTIKLRSNQMVALRKESFEPVWPNLRTLDVSDNAIASIEPGFFGAFEQLEVVQLDGQPLGNVIGEDMFAGLDSLQRLSLQNTRLTTSAWSAVKDLANLNSLNMADNQIMEIPPFTFSKLTQLATLDLSNNSLTALSQSSVHGPQSSLMTVNLNSNGLETIPECTFFGFTKLDHIKLNSNPLKCDCSAVWLRRWIDVKFPGMRKYVLRWECASPEALKDQKVYDVTEAQLCPAGHTPVQCEAITLPTTPPPTTPTPPPGGESTTPVPPPGEGVSNITNNAALVSWVVPSGNITGFMVEVLNKRTNKVQESGPLPPNTRRLWLSGLEPSTDYTVCVTYQHINPTQNTRPCRDFTTVQEPAAVTGGSNTGAIVGAVIGVLAFLALLVLLGFLVVRSRSSGDPLFTKPRWWGGGGGGGATGGEGGGNTVKSRTPTGMPQIGYNSKRFSRPRTTGGASNTTSTTSSVLQNRANNDLEMKLAGFTPEERDHIINMLTTSGGSTLSMISNGSSQRYVPELPPRPQHLEGYLNPQDVRQDEDDDPQKHIYDEIPGAQGNYYEVPLGGASNHGVRRPSVHSGKYEIYKEPGECHI